MNLIAKARLYGALLIMPLVFSGCVVRHGDFSVVSNKLVRLSDFELGQSIHQKNAVGKDVQHVIILFPTSGPPTIEGALDDALDRYNGDVITDAVIKSWAWYIPYIYGQAGWSVEGDVVKTRTN